MFNKFYLRSFGIGLLFLFTEIWSMQTVNSSTTLILEPSDFLINPSLSIQSTAELSFHQIQSIPHSFTLYDFLNTAEGQKLAENVSSSKMEDDSEQVNCKNFKESLYRLKNPKDSKKLTFDNFNIGCGSTASGYYALFNGYIILKSIFSKTSNFTKETLKELYNFNNIAALFWDNNLNKNIRNVDIKGRWRKLVEDFRKNKKILNWYNSSVSDNSKTKDLSIATRNYLELKEIYEKKGMELDFDKDKNQGLSLSIDEIEENIRVGKENDNEFLYNVSILDKDWLVKNPKHWEQKVLPILEDFKNQKNKVHLFILKENATNWYSLVINKSDNKIQLVLADSSNEFALNKIFLNQICSVLELRPFVLILNHSPKHDEHEKMLVQKPSHEKALKEKENVTGEVIISQETLKLKDFAGKLPELIEDIINALNNSELFSSFGEKVSNRFLLHGPPGTGKSMIAKVIAGETNRVLFEKNGGNFISMYQGSGAKSVEDLFETAKKTKKPCVIFIDEIDGFSSNRKATKNEDRQNALLFLLDRLDKHNGDENIFIVVATNDLEGLDHAISSRFNERFLMPLPDFENRLKILEFRFNKISSDKKKFDNDFMKVVAVVTQGSNVRELIAISKATISYSVRAKRSSIISEDIVKAICENKAIADKEKLKEKANKILYKIHGFSGYYMGSSTNDSDTKNIKEMVALIEKEIAEHKKKEEETKKSIWDDQK